nr:MAG TPA: hypothetical protein [Caudoviricetes sp.]
MTAGRWNHWLMTALSKLIRRLTRRGFRPV